MVGERPRNKGEEGGEGRVFWLNVDVKMLTPLWLEGVDDPRSEGSVRGAIMEFGVTAATEAEAKRAIESWLSRDSRFAGLGLRVEYDYVGEIDDLQSEVYGDEDVASALLQDPRRPGIWYRTGVGWYSDD